MPLLLRYGLIKKQSIRLNEFTLLFSHLFLDFSHPHTFKQPNHSEFCPKQGIQRQICAFFDVCK